MIREILYRAAVEATRRRANSRKARKRRRTARCFVEDYWAARRTDVRRLAELAPEGDTPFEREMRRAFPCMVHAYRGFDNFIGASITRSA